MLFNSSLFNQITFFLSNKTKVNSLEEGASKYGGATQIENSIYSNVEGDSNIKVNSNNNSISLFVPSTIEVNSDINNTEYVNRYLNNIQFHFSENEDILLHRSKGSWYSDDLKKTVIEDITIIEVITKELTQKDINFMLNLGIQVKNDMSQECVSISINDSLCLV